MKDMNNFEKINVSAVSSDEKRCRAAYLQDSLPRFDLCHPRRNVGDLREGKNFTDKIQAEWV